MTESIFIATPTPHVTNDPAAVARHLVQRGEWGPDKNDSVAVPKIVILDHDDEVVWWLSPEQAAAVATRINALLGEIQEGRPLRRLASIDEHLRELDQ